MPLSIEELYLPDRKRLGTLWAGTSGSGKTTAVISTLRQAILSPKFGEFHRFVMIDPKVQNGDYDLLVDPIFDINEVFKSMDKNRMTLYWPYYEEFDTKTIEYDISLIVDEMFRLADKEPRATFTFILDESSIVITPTRVPASLKRLAVQERAKGIIPSFISQRPLTNRWLDANLSNVLLFRMLPVDSDNLSKRWGVDFESADAMVREKPFSFLRFSLEDISISKIEPVELPKRLPRKKKKSLFQKLTDSMKIDKYVK